MQTFRAEVRTDHRGENYLFIANMGSDGWVIPTPGNDDAKVFCDQINKGGEVMQRLANGERLAWLQKPTRLVMPPIEIEQEEGDE